MYKFRQLIATIVSTLTIAAAPVAVHAGPDFKWWATGQTSGQINLTNASGVQRQNLPSNPTGAQAVRSANTQAPTVIVQATQSLPVKNIGDTCTQTTSGTAPNQSAAEGTAITPDRIMLLTCNAATGVWLPSRVYANEGDACNVIYKTTSYAIGDRLVLAAALPSGTIASNSAGLTLSCQNSVWKKQSGGWINLSLADTNPFDPHCTYIMNGARASYVDSSQIMSVQNAISGSSTATWQAIYSSSKNITYWAQDNYTNNLYYGGATTSGISYSCP